MPEEILEQLEEAMFTKNGEESREGYLLRCFALKEDNYDYISWRRLASKMNRELGEKHDHSYYIKRYHKWVEARTNLGQTTTLTSDDKKKAELESLLRQVKINKAQLSDERVQNNAYLRSIAREETLKEIAANAVREMSRDKLLRVEYTRPLYANAHHEGIVMLSDWHYGMSIKNYFNTYNPEICADRLCELRDAIIRIGKKHNIRKIHVTNLSDLIAGRIHLSLRLESVTDVITQVMHVSELLAEFLTDLSEHFEIDYRDVVDNHSRLEPNKKDSLELETLVRIIPWYLEQRLKDNKRIKILYNTFADDIISFKVFDFNIVAVHGHKDSPAKVINNMIAATRQRNDLVLTAHLHHFSSDEEQECLRISNGSLMGVDTYAQDLRLHSKASQNFIVVSKDNVAKAIYKINLN